MELLQPMTGSVVASYVHPVWGQYAAITRNRFGKGEVMYVGFMPSDGLIEKVLVGAVDRAGISRPGSDLHFPVIVRSGINSRGRMLHYLLNYTGATRSVAYPFASGVDLLSGKPVGVGSRMELEPWGVAIVQEDRR
jgi:beta-galactosidase